MADRADTEADLEIVEVPIPASPGAPGWELFATAEAVSSAIEVDGYGTDDSVLTAEEALPHWRDPRQEQYLFVARERGRVVGRLAVWSERETPEAANAFVQVLPSETGRGIGGRLHAHLLELAAATGRRKLITWAVSRDGGGERLDSPTGFGSVPRGNREVRFLLDRGWRLEQVERASRFVLPGDPGLLQRLRAETEPGTAGYRLVTWAGITPEELRDGMAELTQRMTTDAPSAGLEEAEETWDAARVLENDTNLEDGPTTMLTTAVEHVATGRLAGMTRLRVPDDPSRAVHQWDTIVRREDRGHRLGMLLKLENIAQLAARMPGHPSIITWNAEENRHMLSVNEAIGFEIRGYEGAWRLDLAPGAAA
jgi:GNAT superfamily N-acetyltransferase